MSMGQGSIQNGKKSIAASSLDYFRAFGCFRAFPKRGRKDRPLQDRGGDGEGRTMSRKKKNSRRPVIISAAVFSAICMIIICTTLWGSLRSNANNGFKYYTSIIVQPGETLWELADQYIDYENYKDKQSYISEVMSINHLEEDAICAGQMLVVPYYSSEYIY